jgi:hypothetical protein
MKQKHPFPKIIKVVYKIQGSAYRWDVVFTCAPSAKRSAQLNYNVNLPPWMTDCLLLEAWHIQNSAIATRTARSKALPYLNENPHHNKKKEDLQSPSRSGSPLAAFTRTSIGWTAVVAVSAVAAAMFTIPCNPLLQKTLNSRPSSPLWDLLAAKTALLPMLTEREGERTTAQGRLSKVRGKSVHKESEEEEEMCKRPGKRAMANVAARISKRSGCIARSLSLSLSLSFSTFCANNSGLGRITVLQGIRTLRFSYVP